MSVRQKFLSFFEKHDHLKIKSASLVPAEDPTLLFINAGMAPLKQYFLGKQKPPHKNLVSIQKCIRAGGKHNDLDQVGYTKRHHTFFEMCGNFSFGGYAHEQAIELAWKFLIVELQLDSSKLHVTVHPDDKVSAEIWSGLIPAERIHFLEANEWSMGNDGPCGMCTEIFYDHGPHLEGNLEDGDRFVEIWNIVLMTHNLDGGTKKSLAQICIDTGMGLERIEAVLVSVADNYDAPLFKNLIDKLVDLTGVSVNADYKIIADHARTVIFAITDGIIPDTAGRGYVIRKILRRALTRAFHYDKADREIGGLVKFAAHYMLDQMKEYYPELAVHKDLISQIIDSEREQLSSVLENGYKHLLKLRAEYTDIVPGEVLFKLHDTYGVPVEFISEVLEDFKLTPNMEEFAQISEEHKIKIKPNYENLDLEQTETLFIGYTQNKCKSKIVQILDLQDKVLIVLDQTVFYAEKGGQEADHGKLIGSNWEVDIDDVKEINGIIVHYGNIKHGNPQKGDQGEATIDLQRRANLMNNHSATHLLLAALRKYLGNSIIQKGSLVKADGLRFDFLYHKPIEEILPAIELQVNQWIQENKVSNTLEMTQKEALDKGAIATFGEKYGEKVRVVEIGSSTELCCGTHVNSTSEIGVFFITKERSVSANVRRIEAVTGQSAYEYAKYSINTIKTLSKILKVAPDELEKAVVKQKSLKNEIMDNQAVLTFESPDHNIIYMHYQEVPANKLLLKTDELIQKYAFVLITSNYNDKMQLLFKQTPEQAKTRTATDIMQALVKHFGGPGKCGGREDFVQTGLSSQVEPALIWAYLAENLKNT